MLSRFFMLLCEREMMNKVLDILTARLQAAGRHNDHMNEYKKLRTDEDRVIFTLNLMQEYNMIPSATGRPKDATESDKLREQGNQIFVKSGTDSMLRVEALKLYTRSIAFAPYPSRQLALAYANRSAILFEFGLFSECIQDIDRALILDYPDDLKAKLCIRKTHCLISQKINQPMEEMLEETECWLEKMSLSPNQMKLRAKFDVLRKTVQTGSNVTGYDPVGLGKSEHDMLPLPIVISYNNEIPCASDAVAIRYNKRYGRHIVATRDIRPGEVIAVEKPYSLLLMCDNMQTHCSNCLKVCWANIPCKYCTYAMYCSEECRDLEWKKYHDVECVVFPSLMEYGFINTDLFSMRLAVLAVREAGSMQQLRIMLDKVDKCDDPRTKGFSQDGKLHSDKYIGLYSLVRNTEKRPVTDLFGRSLYTSFIIYLLATRTTIFGAKLPENLNILAKNKDVSFFGGLILRHQQIIPSNIHSFNEESGLESVQRGMAAMPFCSLINHSCNPNILRHSRPNHMVIYAIYPIRAGEQILDSYGEHYAIMPRAMRRKDLFRQYFFICDCIPCQENWPLYMELKSFKTLVKTSNNKKKITKALKKFNIYIELATKGNVLDKPFILKDLLMMIQTLHDYSPMPCEEMINVVETLKRVYDLSGNRFAVPKVLTF